MTVERMRCPRVDRRADVRAERGSGSVWVLSMLLLLAVFAAFLTGLGAVSAQQARAAAAADLAALTGADVLAHFGSSRDACSAAARLAEVNRAAVESCAVTGDVLELTVVARGAALFGLRARATARAGPTS